MNENNRLLRELLETEALVAVRQLSLGEMLRSARARQRRRALSRACLFMALPGILLGTYLRNRPGDVQLSSITAPQRAPAEQTQQASTAKVSYLSTEELFALFPNRPLALIGPPGEQRLVFLDQPEASQP